MKIIVKIGITCPEEHTLCVVLVQTPHDQVLMHLHSKFWSQPVFMV